MKARNRFHSLCPYFAMFPETFVRRNVLAWSKPDAVVLDPFSGRGTTVFESLLNGRRALGCDLNPVAVCLSRAKATPPTLSSVRRRIAELADAYKGGPPSRRDVRDPFFRLCFSPETLRQILFLREELDWRRNNVDCMIAAITLGVLHGESHKTELCLSNRMPRTISTKPGYSVRWWNEHGYLPPRRNAFEIIETAASYRYASPLPGLRGRVVEGDARNVSRLLHSYQGKVRLVITSPPYLDITNYHEDQWLRLWFLGGPSEPMTRQGRDDRHRRTSAYWDFLNDAWKGVNPLLAPKAQIVVRIGGTRLSGTELRAGLLASLNASGRKYRLAEWRRSSIKNGQSRVFQKTRKPAMEHDFRFVTG
jgi:hypothetical protein